MGDYTEPYMGRRYRARERRRCALDGCTRRAMRDGPFCSKWCLMRHKRAVIEE